MKTKTEKYLLIDHPDSLQQFVEENASIDWMAFDTEFVGEKRYHTLLCTIQIATEHGLYIIDPITLEQFDPFLEMIQNPAITKVTHAGENDYRLLYNLFGIVPRKVFDSQVAAGFLGYRYPMSFSKLVEQETGRRLPKGYTVSDWETRPMNKKQLRYALDDVVYLVQLKDSIGQQLDKLGRKEWLAEELARWETAAFYQLDPHREALTNSLILGLSQQEQVFMLRLYEWRRRQAERKNYSKEMILPAKYIGFIIRNIKSGKGALKNHRRIPNGIVQNHWETFNALFQPKATEEERAILKRIPPKHNKSSQEDIMMEMLQILIKITCQKKNISPDLLTNRANFKKMRSDLKYFDPLLESGWRQKVLGPELISWLRDRQNLEVHMEAGKCTIQLGQK
ncbi:MAG: ribonuclease D [Bacteroidota bacterium]